MIDANTLRNNRYGLYIQSGSPQVTGNVVRDNDDYGIWITTSGSAPVINGRNEITANNRGIYVQGNSNAAFNPLPVVTGNDLYGNSQHDYYAASFGNAANVTLDATGNWWGTPDPTAIGAKIYDRSESAGSPTVNFSGYLDGSGGTGVGGNTLTGTFSVDTTLVTNTSHAVLGDLYVPQGVTLTLEAGVVLNFTNIYNLTVDGTLIVQGSQAEPVVLTSSRSAPSRGDWQGVILSADSVGNLIDYAEIRYAQTGLDLRSDGVTVSNSVVEHSSQNGVRISDASPMIDANTLRNNRYGLYIQSGSPQVTGNVVRDNDDYGIWITTSGSAPLINGHNEITANTYGIYVQGNGNAALNPLPVVNGNDLYGNSQHDYHARSFGNAANVTLDATGNWWGTPDPTAIGAKIYDRAESPNSPTVDFGGYLDDSEGTSVGGNTLTGTFSVDTRLSTNTSHTVLGDLYVPQGVTLTLEAGVVLNFTNVYNLTVDGTLIVQGSQAEPVVLTSSRSAPSRGDWQGVILSADSVGNLIDYAEIRYAQTGLDLRSDGVTVSNSVVEHSSQNGIRINGASPMIDANTLRNNRYGLYIQSGSPQVTGNVVRDNDDYGIWITTSGSAPLINGRNEITANNRGIYVQGNGVTANNPLPLVNGNDLYGNSQHDYYAASFGDAANVTLDATGNWWGTTDPGVISSNIYDHQESASSPTVNFDSYLDEPGGGIIIDTGPELTNLQFNGSALTDGDTLTQPGSLSITATDTAGVSRVEFYIDGTLLATDTNGNDGYSAYWDLISVVDGSYTLTLSAFDTLAHQTDLTINVTVALAPPPAPQLTAPADGTVTNQPTIAVTGTALLNTEVLLYRNDELIGDPLTVNASGEFSGTVNLIAGDNRLQASARHRAGEGPKSVEITVTRDTSVPEAPTNLTASPREGGVVRLTWNPVAGNDITGYDLYRSTVTFDDIATASKVNNTLLTTTQYDDLPPVEGLVYYRVAAVNEAGTSGTPSNLATVTVDNTPPEAQMITYDPQGNFDPNTGRYAQGRVDVIVIVSEPLLTTPFLSLATSGGAPITAVLNKVTDTEYQGYFEITEYAGTGTAFAVFSARDKAGNRGTYIDSGNTLEIDTQGPSVTRIDLAPGHPIANSQTNPTLVNVDITLDEAIGPSEVAQLFVQPSFSGSAPLPISLSEASDTVWSGSFTLPADAGLAEPELLLFTYEGVDDLGNMSTTIFDSHHIQVYQEALPPLEVPANVEVVSLPGGHARITWIAVDEAADYELFRQAPGETELTVLARSGNALEYLDSPATDGEYLYAVASVRAANNDEAVSALSEPLAVNIDRFAPFAPTGLTLQLIGAGIEANWFAPTDSDTLTYKLYRDSITPIGSVDGLTAVATREEEITAIDPNPISGLFAYAVTAVDAAGNESGPSNTVYFNFELLPVSTFFITQIEDQVPTLSWSHGAASIDHYDLYLGTQATGFQLNGGPLTGTTFIDNGYSQDERLYTVVAVDGNGTESVGRSLLLPKLTVTPREDSIVRLGIMNRLQFNVINEGEQAIDNARLKVELGGQAHVSAPFDIEPGQGGTVVPVVVGGYAGLNDLETLVTTVEITPNEGEVVTLVRNHEINTAPAGLAVGIAVQDFVRGGQGQAQFSIANTSEVEIELITARNDGNAPSDQVLFKLLDSDENVLATQGLRQFLGSRVITLASGTTVARVMPGELFISDWVDIDVPAAAPGQITVQVDISALHYHFGQDDAVTIAGLSGRRSVPLIDTPYYGVIDSITPALSYGDQPITITGRSLVRADDTPLPRVPLNVILNIQGFERTIALFTDENGQFSYDYTPPANEAGIYHVSLVHPDLAERPQQGSFTVAGLSLQYRGVQVNTARHYDETITVRATTSEGATFTNLRFELAAEDQANGQLPVGITLTPVSGTVISLTPNTHAELQAIFRADDTPPDTGTVVWRVASDEHPKLVTFAIDYRLVDAQPLLTISPNSVDTGVTKGNSVSETILLENKGLISLEDVQVQLLDAGGTLPDWARLSSPAVVGDLGVGEMNAVSVTFSPDASVADGVYPIRLQVSSANAPTKFVDFSVAVTPSGEGRILFKVEDIYTLWPDDNTGEPIPGLEGATIRLQNEQVPTETATFVSDENGEVLTTYLPAGTYRFRASAPNHTDTTGRVQVKAGVDTAERIFIDYSVVSVQWSVTETTIEDRYDIVLTATYAVDVPTAVIIMEPASISLPALQAGDVYYGEITLTNYGFIRADDLKITLPADDEYLSFEVLLSSVPTSLASKERITVPYRIIALRTLGNEDDSSASGGGCFTYATEIRGEATSECVNGEIVYRGSSTTFTYRIGTTCPRGGDPDNEDYYANPVCSLDPDLSVCGQGGGRGGREGADTGISVFSGFPACRPGGDDPCGLTGNGPGDE